MMSMLRFGRSEDRRASPQPTTFIRIDLFGIQEEVAERFDDLPIEPTAPDVRVLVLTGLMFRQAAVYAAEMPDGIVYLIGLEVAHY